MQTHINNNLDQTDVSINQIDSDMTFEDFFASDIEGYEFVNGELKQMSPPTMEHGEISMSLILPLGTYIREKQMGRLYPADTTFNLGDRLVKPDLAYVSNERLPDNRRQGSPIPPDLAVEVTSPSDSQYDIIEKALAYLEAGTRLVWVIEPIAQTVTVYRSKIDIKTLTHNDTLTGEDVVRGFSCLVAQLFE